MKGQYRIITEIMLFAIGLSITSYIVISFGNVQEVMMNITMKDNMNDIANLILNGLIKSSMNINSTIKLSIPEKISNEEYKISIKNDEIRISSLKTGVYIVRQLFNISQSYSINTEVVSMAKFIEIVNENNEIKIKRSKRL
ncbi:MAG: hypothetical protein QXD48_01975 [Candidatus Aenigmatarchaeota archaeon]